MRRLLLGLFFVALMATPALAKKYSSSFSFTVDVPDYWLVLTRDEVAKNPELYGGEGEAPEGLDSAMWEAIQGDIKAGKIEYWYDLSTTRKDFKDNINVRKEIAALPTAEELPSVCQMLPGWLSTMFGRDIKMHGCEFRTAGGKHSLFLDFDGVLPDTRSMQYQIQQPGGAQIQITATCVDERVESVRKDLDAMMRSIKFAD